MISSGCRQVTSHISYRAGGFEDCGECAEDKTFMIFWWSDLYSLKEQQPDLIVTGQRLDAKAPPLHASKATNASGGDIGESMLTGVDFPTLGCWKITGQYKDAELSFVVWVAP